MVNKKKYRHHRQLLLSSRTAFPSLPAGELDFLMKMFTEDSKNYHVWTYRQWLVRRFDLWDTPREIDDVDALLLSDVRNNSAWNHRYMLRFAPRQGFEAGMWSSTNAQEKGKLSVVDEDLIDSELDYTQAKILLAPENRSAWLYARGVLRAADRPLSEWKGFASRFITEENGSDNTIYHVKSSLAVEWLADVFAQEAQQQEKEDSEKKRQEKVDEAVRLLTLLKEKYDPVRVNYWDYRIREIRRPMSAV
jgi:protein farnesyltransferase/geranylgeranyltransferase type-1 subunit alpha